MKIRTMKLREAHKAADNGESSLCSVLWAADAGHIVTASSSDNTICIHDASSPLNAPKSLRNHREGVTTLARSPNSTCLASGSLDHSVKLYKFPGKTKQKKKNKKKASDALKPKKSGGARRRSRYYQRMSVCSVMRRGNGRETVQNSRHKVQWVVAQILEFRVFNISHGSQHLRGRLPLTPGSNLTWFGFSEEGQLSSFDSKGTLRVFTSQFGGSWLPLFSASKIKKSEENYWVAGLNTSKLFCIVCKSPETFPQSTPKPVLTLLDLSFPLAASDLGADSLENEFMMNNMHLSRIQRSMEERAASGLDTTLLDDEAFNVETSLDRCILRFIASCCNSDKPIRATELVKLLLLEKSVRGAIKLVTALKLPNLAERFNSILEEKLLSEREGNMALPDSKSKYNCSFKPEVASSKFFTAEINRAAEAAVISPVHTLASTSNLRARNSEEPTKDRNGKTEESKTMTSGRPIELKATVKVNANRPVHDAGEAKKATKVDQLCSSRPSNPFAKSSSNQESPSMFDSLKKMKKTDIKEKS